MRPRQVFFAMLLAASLGACGPSKSDSTDMAWSQIGVSAVAPRTLGVNAYLWQASVETFSFLPLIEADPYGGVIVSDWYSTPNSPQERMKVTVYIMDRALRAEGLKVRVFRQQHDGTEWKNVRPNPDMGRNLEDAILTRARQLRMGDRTPKAP